MISASLDGVGDRGIPFINLSIGLAWLLINHFLLLRCLLRHNRAKKKMLFLNSLPECLSISELRVTLICYIVLLCCFVFYLLSNYSIMAFLLILGIVKQLKVIRILTSQVQGCEVCLV